MTQIILYLTTGLLFIIADVVMLRYVMRPLFDRHIGNLMLADPRLIPAAMFYFGYVVGVVLLVSLPALRAQLPMQALINGALLGALAYGTFEFTSYAIMRDWHIQMVIVDVVWGAILTSFIAWGGVVLTQKILGT
ncbi:MAG: putative membrane protein [Paracoccaceae bacterium]|jgi:uncharacterized membrane protein